MSFTEFRAKDPAGGLKFPFLSFLSAFFIISMIISLKRNHNTSFFGASFLAFPFRRLANSVECAIRTRSIHLPVSPRVLLYVVSSSSCRPMPNSLSHGYVSGEDGPWPLDQVSRFAACSHALARINILRHRLLFGLTLGLAVSRSMPVDPTSDRLIGDPLQTEVQPRPDPAARALPPCAR